MVVDLYNAIKDLIDEARKQKNLDMVEKLIDIKVAISDLKDENVELRKRLELKENVVRHEDGNYITLQNDPLNIKYCSTCWGNDDKLIQIEKDEIISGYPKCPICFANLLKSRNKS